MSNFLPGLVAMLFVLGFLAYTVGSILANMVLLPT
jgi:hypothetical protein